MSHEPILRGDLFLVALDPTPGREACKARVCLVVSPDELNGALGTFTLAPLTTGEHDSPFRIPCRFSGRSGFVVLDQLRTVDRAQLIRKVGRVNAKTLRRILAVLQEMFASG